MIAPPFVDPVADRAARTGAVDAEAWQLVVGGDMYRELIAHLFPGDGEEHAAVIAAGVVMTSRGTRLVARDLVLAVDGEDFVPARDAHCRLTPAFVNRQIRYCRDEGLAYLAIHNHGPGDRVGFSRVDLASHERGYPALLDIARGLPVGALVLATRAVAGDVWTSDGARHPIGETVILDGNRVLLAPTRAAAPPASALIDDRQARIYGPAGQAILRRMKVAVIGAGGAGMPIVVFLARLGVGHIVVIDADRVDITNLPRLPDATRRDAMAWLTDTGRPGWVQGLGRRLATPKVRVAARAGRRARKDVVIEALHADVSDAGVKAKLIDCDHLFLAADSDVARAVFNVLVFGFLIPGTQVGSKVMIEKSGAVGDVFSIVRPVGPDAGCLWCNGIISPTRLADQLLPDSVREAQRYLPDQDAPAPSVITLNALGVGHATHRFMLWATGLLRPAATHADFRRTETRGGRTVFETARRDAACRECGHEPSSLRARADRERL